MEVYYRREMKGNYLIIEPETWQENSYPAKMMVNNTIEGLLKFRIKYIDQKHYFYYEITSKQPLGRMLESRYITVEEIRKIISGIAGILNHIEIYLLREEQILLDQEYVYVDPDTFELYLCLVPGRHTDFATDLGFLLQYLLKKVDHQDRESVILAYGLFQESQKDNYAMSDLLRLVTQNNDHSESKNEHVTEKRYNGHEDIPEVAANRDRQPAKVEKESKVPWAGTILFMVAVPIILWVVKGTNVILYYIPYLIGWEVLCIIFLFLPQRQNKKDLETNLNDVFEFEEEQENIIEPKIEKSRMQVPRENEQEHQTVLLADLDEHQDVRKLVCVNHQIEDIYILYYPFIIGKQEGLVDYTIAKETISRFHMRIDKIGETYYITDLNSTNGTKVKEKLLETNEKVKISLGDDIYLADIRFRFS